MAKKRYQNPHIELLFALSIVLISLAALLQASTFSPRAKLLPVIVTCFLIVLGSIQIWYSWNAVKEYKNKGRSVRLMNIKLSENKHVHTILVMLAYPVILYFLGFVLASIFEIAALMMIRGVKSRKRIAILTLVTPFIIYLVFNTIAGVNLPKGPLGF